MHAWRTVQTTLLYLFFLKKLNIEDERLLTQSLISKEFTMSTIFGCHQKGIAIFKSNDSNHTKKESSEHLAYLATRQKKL